MDEVDEGKTAAGEFAQKQHLGLLGTPVGAVLAQQHQQDYRREQALHLALQANGGSQPYPVSKLIEDADIILTWLAPKVN